ncbi:hypothetical protein [Nocardioides daejeonensis]|uniref:hypothetical protein n=1 Tax=Nocardioides daejeonensis TaxID=1046556 RepID=UPI0013A5AB54|nr:hypothetical protein [Nocardioides daejeonensis]
MPRELRTLRVATVAALALVLLGAWLIHLSSPTRGPVQFHEPWTGAAAGVAAGLTEPVTSHSDAVYGLVRIDNSSDKPARLTAVRALGDADPLHAFLAETRLLVQLPDGGYPGGQIGISLLDDRFSRNRWEAGQSIPGAVLPPRTTGTLMLRFRLVHPIAAEWSQVKLDYEVDDRTYTSAGALGFSIEPAGRPR